MDDQETRKLPIPRAIVGAIIYNDEGKIILAKAKKWGERWAVCGGHIDWGETSEQAIRREAREEFGIELEDVKPCGVQEAIFPEEFHEKRHFLFFDFFAKAASEDIKLNEEFEEYKWFKPEEALELKTTKYVRKGIKEFIEKKKKATRQ